MIHPPIAFVAPSASLTLAVTGREPRKDPEPHWLLCVAELVISEGRGLHVEGPVSLCVEDLEDLCAGLAPIGRRPSALPYARFEWETYDEDVVLRFSRRGRQITMKGTISIGCGESARLEVELEGWKIGRERADDALRDASELLAALRKAVDDTSEER